MSNEIYVLAFGAGMVSFVSPCVLPLLPGYLSFISGSSAPVGGDNAKPQTSKMLYTTVLFVVGFSAVFSLLGSAFGEIGSLLRNYRTTTQIIAGVVIIGMGILVTGFVRIPSLYREVRSTRVQRFGSFGALPLGMAFAVGWTPCIGPILASIYMLALSSPGNGAMLLLIYSLGLGLPFVISGLLFSRLSRSLGWLKTHSVLIQRASGVVLVAIGALMLTGKWALIFAPLQRYFRLPV